jgi:hypothetical protein
MFINVSINEVLRDFISQLTYVYDKYIGPSNIKEGDVTNFELMNFFKFDSKFEMSKFIYMEAPLEIFGHADLMSDNLMNHFNYFIEEMKDEEINVKLVSREVNKSIPSTLFFLSKTGCRAQDIHFVDDSKKEWDNADILITANPDALINKPNGKISVKIKASYNKDIAADFELDSILDFIKDENLRTKILTTKITTYEEI